MRCRRGTTVRSSEQLLTSSRSPSSKDAPASCLSRNASPRSIRTARSGSSNQCIRNSSSHSNKSGCWDPLIRNGRPRRRSQRSSRATRQRWRSLRSRTLEAIMSATHTGMSSSNPRCCDDLARNGTAQALGPALHRLNFSADARAAGLLSERRLQDVYRIGGGQEFIRVYAEHVYNVPLEQVIGSVGGTAFAPQTGGIGDVTRTRKSS